jgi:hypothetical protein
MQESYVATAQNEGTDNSIITLIEVLGLLVVAIALIGLVGTLTLALIERGREVGILRCLGASARQVRRVFNAEAAVMATAGWALGSLLGYALFLGLLAFVKHDFGITLVKVFPLLSIPVALVVVVRSHAARHPPDPAPRDSDRSRPRPALRVGPMRNRPRRLSAREAAVKATRAERTNAEDGQVDDDDGEPDDDDRPGSLIVAEGDARRDRADHHGTEGQEGLLRGELAAGVSGSPVPRVPAARTVGRWLAGALVKGDALIDATVDLGADPLDQARRYCFVVAAAEVAERPDRRGDFLFPARVQHMNNAMERRAVSQSRQHPRSR